MVENKYYERKIKYLDLLESGERTGGAGFVKVEVQGMEINLTVTVKGLHVTDTYERDVMLQAGDGEFAVGRIALKEGQGQFKYYTVMDYFQLQGIRIILDGTREICCKWQAEKRSSAVRDSAAQDNIKQNDMPMSSKTEQIEEKQQSGSKKSREIQLIPWTEIKMVEESLERVDQMMSKPTEKDAWKAAEKNVKKIMKGAENREKLMNKTEEREATGESTTGESATGESATGESATGENATGKSVTRESVTRENSVRETGEREIETGKASEETISQITVGRATTSESLRESPAGRAGITEGNITGTRGRNTTMENTASRRTAERRTDKSVQRIITGGSARQEKVPVRLMEDKWKQIWAIYPHIHPFQDEREYLSISPADFVLLPDEAYRAANNSFLLHGYYNYDHLILTKIERRGEVSYYIGVPGNYYEREKQVAIMFGFESFECGTEPAQAGDFGYYMMRTQL